MKYRDSSGRVTNNPYQQLINIKKYNINFDDNLKKTFSKIEKKEAEFEIDWLTKYRSSISNTELLSYYLNFYLILEGLDIKIKSVEFSEGIFTLIFNRNTLNVEKELRFFLRIFLNRYNIISNNTVKKTIKLEKTFSYRRELFLNLFQEGYLNDRNNLF